MRSVRRSRRLEGLRGKSRVDDIKSALDKYLQSTYDQRQFRHDWVEIGQGCFLCTHCRIEAEGPNHFILVENHVRPCVPILANSRLMTLTLEVGGHTGKQTLQTAWLPDLQRSGASLMSEAEWIQAVQDRIVAERVLRQALINVYTNAVQRR